MIASPEHLLRECIADYSQNKQCNVEVLEHYGSDLAHIVADMVETAG